MRERIIRLLQDILNDVPTILLGSGASAPYGIPLMHGLRDYLIKNIYPTQDDEYGWEKFKRVLSEKDLESTLQEVDLSPTLEREISRNTRQMIYDREKDLTYRIITGELSLALTALLRYLFQSTQKSISVITTNYDRLAEIAADVGRFAHNTGFSHGYIRHWEKGQKLVCSRGGQQIRTVDVWKVHGSIDWFRDSTGNLLSLPDGYDYPAPLEPVLITPGLQKYQKAYHEPFRTIIAEADRSLSRATSFLYNGYGFNYDYMSVVR